MSEYTNVTVNHAPGPDGDQSASRVITILTSRLEELQSNPVLAETEEEQTIVNYIQQNQEPQLTAEDLAIIERIKEYGPQDGKDLNYVEQYGIVVNTPVVPAEDIETRVEYEPTTSPDIETSVKEVSEEDVTAQVEEEEVPAPYSYKVSMSANKSSNQSIKQSVTNNMTKNNEINVISHPVGGKESEDLIIRPELEKSGENIDGYTFKHSPTEGGYLSTTEDNLVQQSDYYIAETVQEPPFSNQEMNPLATMSVAGFIPLVLGLVVKKFRQ